MAISRAQAGKQTRSAPASRKKRKVKKVMSEFKQGKLKSGSGQKVKNRKQAVAIAMSVARRHNGRKR